MLNEGIVFNDTKSLVKSQIVREIRRLGPTNPDELERAVFQALTGLRREDVNWEYEDNHAGYYLWVKSFDQLLDELVDDGYIRVEKLGTPGTRRLHPVETEHDPLVSQAIYPSG